MSFRTNSSFRAALMGSAATAVLALSMAPVAFAQDEESVEEVVVTGSRIVRKDIQAASPVTVLNAEEITYTGTTRIEDLVASLPQAFAAQNSTVANGSSGTATVSLRHLGSTRTLVTINGRRSVSGDPFASAPDLNFIPTQLIERVDVLTGGASAVYGSDAVAGVVNFILDTDFEGLRMNAQHSFYQHRNDNAEMQAINEARGFEVPDGNIVDGHQWNISAAAGSSFADGRGHASAYLTYRDIGSITKANRDYTNCTLGRGSNGPVCGGSSTSAYGRFRTKELQYEDDGVTLKTNADGDNVLKTIDYVLDWDGPGDTFKKRQGEVFNYGPFNHIQRPDTKWAAGGFLNYQVSDDIEVYMETMFMDDYTRAQIAPSGNFGRSSQINCDNPMLSAQQFDIICVKSGITALDQDAYMAADDPDSMGDIAPLTILRRNYEGGPRTNVIRHTSYRVVGGFRGALSDNWNFDVYGMKAENIASESYINDLNVDRLKDALFVVTDPDTGAAVCASGNAGCAPWDLFTKDAVSQAALDYISTVAVMNASTSIKMASASATGDLNNLVTPWASEGVQVAIGAEYREEAMSTTPDEVYSKGLRAGGGSRTPAYDVGFNVKELFGEAVIPLVQGMDMVQDLSLEIAARHTLHNITGADQTYKLGATWTVNNDIKFRGGYNRAVRAPGLLNFFAPQNTGLAGMNDLCAIQPGTDLPGATLEECLRTGATQAQYEAGIAANDANQYNTITGGNPGLVPETADTFTLGAVITPDAIPGLAVMVDYYNIKIKGAIGSLGAEDILNTCMATGDAALCSLINRDASDGNLWVSNTAYIETTQQNIGQLNAEGVDINATYSTDVGDMGSVNMALVGTYLLASRFSNPLTDYDCVGYFGGQCGQPDAKWRHKLRVSWNTNFDTTFSVNWRFISSVKNDDFSPDPDIGSSSASNLASWVTNGADKISNRSFFDVTVRHDINENLIASVGVNNILDKEPPLLPTLTSTGYSGTYDTLGRYIFFGLKANF